MAKISYVNGRYVHHAAACVSIEDRGYQFADGAYEVMAFYNRRLLDEDRHLQRLMRSLAELRMRSPVSERSLRLLMRETIARNDREDGTLYLQITRGVAKRDHTFPALVRPSLVMSVTGAKTPKAEDIRSGIGVVTMPDERWARRDIKSISLLPNILAKQAAAEKAAREAWLHDGEGRIYEGSSSNCAIVTRKGQIVTAKADRHILGGITREVVLAVARKKGVAVAERPFTLEEALTSREAFMMSTTANILPVTRINGVAVGTGVPGELTMRLLGLYHDHIYAQTGKRWS